MKRLWLVKSSNLKNSALPFLNGHQTLIKKAANRLPFSYKVHIVKFQIATKACKTAWVVTPLISFVLEKKL